MTSSAQDAQAQLRQLDTQIEARAQAIQVQHDWFPCRRGCDRCCRQLAHPPELSSSEWSRVDAAVAQLPVSIQVEIQQNIQSLLEQLAKNQSEGSVVCPYLDRSEGACFIYGDRPIACRTYGFFVERHHDQYCQIIETEVIARDGAGIVWGNAESIRREMARIDGRLVPFATHYQLDIPSN